jgi:putative ABC transport system ATP-binding protein
MQAFIQFKNILPKPLESRIEPSDIWQKELVLEQGKVYQIISASGKGKSTFCHILYGMRKDYKGELILEGKSSNVLDWTFWRAQKMSVIFQDLRLFNHLSAWENILVKVALGTHFSETEIKAMMEKLGISHLAKQKVETLSYGERQRVAIVRALVQPFQVLIADEPFSHLDAENTKIAAKLIHGVCQKNKATLLITSLGSDTFPFALDKTLKLA